MDIYMYTHTYQSLKDLRSHYYIRVINYPYCKILKDVFHFV